MATHSDITAVAVVILAALVFGAVFSRLKLPALIGYILAGVVLGPSGVALVVDRGDIGLVAELGVLLLLFTIGMQLSLRGFRAVWKTTVGTALLQIAGAVGVMLLLGSIFSWDKGVSITLGFAIALSSTVVALRILEDMNLLRTQVGQITISVLIAQDLAVIPMILIVQMMAGEQAQIMDLARIGFAIGFLVFLCWYLSRRAKVRLPLSGVLAKQADLRPLYGVGTCFGAAVLADYLQLTPAYGAFLAGLLVGNSNIRNVMLRSVRPVQSLMMMAFFVSIGLLVDVPFMLANAGIILTIVVFVTVLKTLFNIGLLKMLGEPWPHAFVSGLLLAQIGEFSFLLGETSFEIGLIGPDEKNLIIAVTVITLLVSPIWLTAVRRIVRIAFSNAQTWRDFVSRFVEGGLAAIAQAARKQAPSSRAATRYFGRAGSKQDRGVIGSRAAAAKEEPSGIEPDHGAE